MKRTILRRQPLLTLVAALTLGTAIGAVGVVTGIAERIWLSPLPYPEADRLAYLLKGNGRALYAFSPPAFRIIQEDSRVIRQAALFRSQWVNYSDTDVTRRVKACAVSASLFEVLGATAALGRTFDALEDLPGKPPIALVSRKLQLQSGLDLGATIALDGVQYQVVGVMPGRFAFPDPGVDVWTPVNVTHADLFDAAYSRLFHAVVHLADGVPLSDAETVLDEIVSGQTPPSGAQRSIRLASMVEQERSNVRGGVSLLGVATGNVGLGVWIAFALTLLLLVTACASVTHLLLADAKRRQLSLATQVALGAPKKRILWEAARDTAILSSAAGLLGFFFSWLGSRLVLQIAPPQIPLPSELGVSWTVLAASLALGWLSVAFPAALLCLRVLGLDSASVLFGQTSLRQPMRPRSGSSTLVAIEFAAAALLLSLAGLLLHSFFNYSRVDAGFNSDGLVAIQIHPQRIEIPVSVATVQAVHRIEEALRSLLGLEAVPRTTQLPLSRSLNLRRFLAGEGEAQTEFNALAISASAHYLEIMNIGLLGGRTISGSDTAHSEPVAVIDEHTARSLWPHQEAIGQMIQLRTSFYEAPKRRIVGVVRRVRSFGISDPVQRRFLGQVYMPALQRENLEPSVPHFVIRPVDTSPQLLAAIQDRIHEVAPSVAVQIHDLMAQEQGYDQLPHFFLSLFGAAAGLTLLLGVTGTSSVLFLHVRQRQHEIGLRIAVGARRRDIGRMVISQGLKMSAVGIAVGCLGALALGRFLQGLLFGLTPSDPSTFAAVAALLLLSALAASLLPSIAAANSDPQRLLRCG